MRILIEEYQYEADKVKDILHGIDAMQNVEGRVSIHYVGYYYNTLLKDCVFILPKVLLKGDEGLERVFGKYKPEDIAHIDNECALTSEEKDFIYKFAVWIYRAIVVYKNDRRSDTSIVYHSKIAQIGKGSRRMSNTYLDILLELLQFNKDNQSFFFFVLKNLHAGFNKINWTRTISRETAIVQGGQPIYLRPVNKRRQVNFDEELLVIFFSILNYICKAFGFTADINFQYDLIHGRQFKRYLDGYGCTRLRQIKYKYFSDKALQLWHLCYAFFDEARQVSVSTDRKEYLLVKNFYIVFEAIIDELIGDTPLPDGMDKKQDDGKIVDHIYTAKSLIESDTNRTYYIGDSKYYKMGHSLGREAVFKQYTYARNVIQWNIDIFNDGKTTQSGVKLRDDVTEGYNIIPNFFISAKMDEGFDYGKEGIEKTDRRMQRYRNEHFKNRLFDRDTLLLFHYDVNFLFVLALYARDNASQKAGWKEKIRRRFREEIQDWLQEEYDFYALKSNGNPVAGEEFIHEHFKELQGKLYRPYGDSFLYAMALEKPKEQGLRNEESELYRILEEHFVIDKVKLGEDPKERVDEMVTAYQQQHPYSQVPEQWLPQYHVERYLDRYFVVGLYHDQPHWDWITGKNDRGAMIYNVRLSRECEGAMSEHAIRAKRPLFAILYEENHERENQYHVFRIHDFAKMTEAKMRQAQYPENHGGPKGDYFIFRFDEEVSIGAFDIGRLIAWHRLDKDHVEGRPLFVKGEELLRFRGPL